MQALSACIFSTDIEPRQKRDLLSGEEWENGKITRRRASTQGFWLGCQRSFWGSFSFSFLQKANFVFFFFVILYIFYFKFHFHSLLWSVEEEKGKIFHLGFHCHKIFLFSTAPEPFSLLSTCCCVYYIACLWHVKRFIE